MKMISDQYPRILIGQYAPDYIGWQPIHGTEEHEHSPSPVVSYIKRGLTVSFATLLIPYGGENPITASVALTEGGFVITTNGESFAFDYNDPRFAMKSNLDQ